MAKEPLPLHQHANDLIARRLADRSLDLADVKAQRYVGRFFHRLRLGRKIVAEVVGNHGTYAVSLHVGAGRVAGSCSCYVGSRGECHHVRALAQTFLEDPQSFAVQEAGTRGQPLTLDDLPRALSAHSRHELVELVGRLAAQLAPRERDRLLAGFAPQGQRALGKGEPSCGGLLDEVDRFIADCERGAYYDWGEVATYREGAGVGPMSAR